MKIYIPINLVVNDAEYNSVESDQVYINVALENTSPVLDIPLNYETTKLSELIIDASLADDSASLTGNLNFDWNVPEGFTEIDNGAESILVLSTPDIGGDYNLILTISDGIVEDDLILNITISVLNNQSPYAVPGDDIFVGKSEEFTLSGLSSYDPDNTGASLSYSWDIDEFNLIAYGSCDGNAGYENKHELTLHILICQFQSENLL